MDGYIGTDRLSQLIEMTYDSKPKYLIGKEAYQKAKNVKFDEKAFKRLIEINPSEALLSTKIYINLSTEISQLDILQAFMHSNLCICLKTPNTINLISDGINGYLFDELDIERIARQVNTLLANKKHLKDICKINKQKSELFDFDLVKKQYKSFLMEL